MNIIVVGNHHRKPLITEHLQDFRFTQHHCADFNLPEDFVDRHRLLPNLTGAYRAFRGHQEAAAYLKTVALVFEDDAVPTTQFWPAIALKAFSYLDRFDWISLHGREYELSKFEKVADLGLGYGLYTNPSIPGINGSCMAYWTKKTTADTYREAVFDGYPCDWYLWQKFKAAIVDPSPFRHDRSQGSLIDLGARA